MRTPLAATLAVSASIAVFVASPSARAADTWTTPHPGVRHLYRTTSAPLKINALVVDLCASGVSVRATKSSERKRTASSFGGLVGAQAVINGDFFSYSTYGTTGLSVGAGDRWTDTSDGASSGFLGFGPHRARFSPPAEVVSTVPTGITEVVSGLGLLVSNGVATTTFDCSGHFCQRHPRTAAGFSKDKRTLYMVTVDGRSTSSRGVTLAELAQIMKDLGAWDAMNYDGGGSTTMWIAGKGVVNTPSDGSQRVVANHLAVFADGNGQPGSCVADPLDAARFSFLHDVLGNTDIDGDGRADICARGVAGMRCHLSTGDGFGPTIVGPAWSDADGWDDPSAYGTIRLADVTGDGKADLCARAGEKIVCHPSNGAGFDAPFDGPVLADADGFADPGGWSTIRFADVTGDGKADLCARSAKGFACWPSTGSGFGPAFAGPELSDAVGWGAIDHWSTLRMGDLNGDGRADLCARAGAGMWCWLSDGKGFPTKLDGPAWSDGAGWDAQERYGSIRLGDLDGDGKLDLCARAAKGVVCSRFDGAAFGPEIEGPGISDASGWDDETNGTTLRFVDVTGDGKDDVCVRGNAGVTCWPSTGSGFGTSFPGPEWSDAGGWWPAWHHRTIRAADLDGDGKLDLCARGASGIHCYKSTGEGFGPRIDGPEWSNAVGWNGAPYYETILFAGEKPKPKPEPGGDAGADASSPGDASIGADGGAIDPDASVSADPTAEDLQGGCACRAPSGRASGDALVLVGAALALAGVCRRRR